MSMDHRTRDLVMGKLYLKNKDYDAAEKSFLDYLNFNPEDYQALKMLAQVYENLGNHRRAFEFYERSYLVDPQRKGTLLDISRLLLIENSGLDHVDRKKWLQKAIQAFPTNPIVTNLRDTLPAFESNPAPDKINLESELMSKMDRLEERLSSIEQLLSRLAVSKAEEQRQTPAIKADEPKPAPVIRTREPIPVSIIKAADPKPASIFKTDHAKSTPIFKPEEPKPAPIFNTVDPKPVPIFKAEEPKVTSIFNTAADPEPSSIFKTEESKSTSIFKTEEPKPAPVFKTEEPKPISSTNTSANSTEFKPIFKPLGEGFTFGSSTAGGNLFADGLKKFNLPTEGPWTTTPVKPSPSPFSFNPSQSSEATETNNQEGGGDDEGDETVDAPELPIENTCDMQPIEIKSGEEDEDVVFEHRCKLFRFRDKEYKERGLGNIKVLKHRTTNAGRLIMRRDLINLVCLNCWSCSKIERVRDTQVRFAGLDASDGEPVMTVFLAKFKTQELTDTFIAHLNELFQESE